ncbi:M28 family metallopeptidase [Nocardioides sp. zg-1228]|uniref:M28 family metallopeptidase n=1 Tax=Nocardioides sp. zg-1228 TaxID=2763008 RepID=UPI00164294AC|nr:M28 family metallopeptidase [Nocardioides sp. zg-1228]MBC2934474.1 M28 family peptidase [Nocardioides sp. zg-1228]QSF59235.1 M28 family peptidase [Nocardioides sp. zg-1228]
MEPGTGRGRGALAAVLAALVLAAGCSAGDEVGSPEPGPGEGSGAAATDRPVDPPASAGTPTDARPEPVAVSPDDLDRATAVGAVRRLAGRIGPREATGASYARAARWVGGEMRRLGYDVTRQRVEVPAGVSWGVPVAGGSSVNVVARPPGMDPAAPHLVVGAHLDTVPQAPGAEDNASGVGVLLAVAEAVAGRRTRLPVVLVAFGAEEPRGPSDDDHHYGSRRYVAAMTPAERRALRAMVSLDRVGVGDRVPIGSAGATDPVQRSLLAAARRAGVPTLADAEQRSSDHWSFVRDGLPAARLGSTPYAGYHSAGDVPGVVSPAQLERVGRVVLAWLAPR